MSSLSRFQQSLTLKEYGQIFWDVPNISTELHSQRECSYTLEFDVVITISKERNLEWAWS